MLNLFKKKARLHFFCPFIQKCIFQKRKGDQILSEFCSIATSDAFTINNFANDVYTITFFQLCFVMLFPITHHTVSLYKACSKELQKIQTNVAPFLYDPQYHHSLLSLSLDRLSDQPNMMIPLRISSFQ